MKNNPKDNDNYIRYTPPSKPVIHRQGENRRAPRVFASVRESRAMTTSAMTLDQPKLEPPARTASRPPMTWGSHGKSQDRARLRLLGALRGDGALVWPGGSIAVTYELDLFGRGPVRLASGNLEGAFSKLALADADPSIMPGGSRLRLDDGAELEIELIALDATTAEFDARGAAVSAYMVSRLVGGEDRGGH